MATRIYCDNCGNTVREPNRFCFGPLSYFHEKEQHFMQMVHGMNPGRGYAGGGGGGGAGSAGVVTIQSQTAPTKLAIPVENIDLCDGCQSIWMDRVRKLTNMSETDG